jgi:hypothetical protein
MLTCKKLENFIGNNEYFYGKSVLKLQDGMLKKLDNPEDFSALMNIRRKFGTISIVRWSFPPESKKYAVANEIFKRIGKNVINITTRNTNFSYLTFINWMRQVNNLNSLNMFFTGFYEDDDDESVSDVSVQNVENVFANLKTLELRRIFNSAFLLKLLPSNTLHELKMFGNCRWTYYNNYNWEPFQHFLPQQCNLKSLHLECFDIKRFQYSHDSKSIEKLSLVVLNFSEKSDLEQFCTFIRNQENILDLELQLNGVIDKFGNDCSELLTYLMNIKSLKNLTVKFGENFQNLQVENLILKSMRIEGIVSDCLSRFFPNVESLEINVYSKDFSSQLLVPINNLAHLKNLKIIYADEEIIAAIESESLVKFTIDYPYFLKQNISAWSNFIKNNKFLEILELNHWNEKISIIEYLKIAVENLENLKILKIGAVLSTLEEEVQLNELIGKNCKKLEVLKMNLRVLSVKTAQESIKSKLPNLKCHFN